LASFAAWGTPLLGAGPKGARLAIELIAPPDEKEPFRLAYALEDPEGKSVEPAAAIWQAADQTKIERLLRGLAESARISPPIERSLEISSPTGVDLSLEEAWIFLSRTAPVLAQSGVGLLLPAGFEEASRRRLRARVRIVAPAAPGPTESGADG